MNNYSLVHQIARLCIYLILVCIGALIGYHIDRYTFSLVIVMINNIGIFALLPSGTPFPYAPGLLYGIVTFIVSSTIFVVLLRRNFKQWLPLDGTFGSFTRKLPIYFGIGLLTSFVFMSIETIIYNLHFF